LINLSSCCALVLALLLPTALTSAQSSEDTDERARLHFRSGAAYYDAGEYEDALREFQSAFELSQRPALYYNLYLCEQAIGSLEIAAEHLEHYLAEVPEVENRTVLEQRLASLRTRIERRAAGEADPGGERDEGRPIDAPPLEASGDETNATEGPAPAEPGLNVPAIAAFSVAAVGLIGAVIFGPLTLAEDSSLAGSPCAASRSCDTGSLTTYALLTDISFGVAAAAAIAGLVLALVYEPAADSPTASLTLTPFASSTGFGLVMGGAL
jgi:tetratricopeptide (TPR) repeat protein